MIVGTAACRVATSVSAAAIWSASCCSFSGFAPRRFFRRLPKCAASRMVRPSSRLRNSATDVSATPARIGAAGSGLLAETHRWCGRPHRRLNGLGDPCRGGVRAEVGLDCFHPHSGVIVGDHRHSRHSCRC